MEQRLRQQDFENKEMARRKRQQEEALALAKHRAEKSELLACMMEDLRNKDLKKQEEKAEAIKREAERRISTSFHYKKGEFSWPPSKQNV